MAISKTIIIMSNNKKKLEELQTLMSNPAYHITSYLKVITTPLDVVEDGDTFEANALKKVTAIKPEALPNPTQTIIIADDSGLEVDALDNRPGIHSARYGGKNLTDTQRCHALLTELGTTTNRNARFVCVIALRFPQQRHNAVSLKAPLHPRYLEIRALDMTPFSSLKDTINPLRY